MAKILINIPSNQTLSELLNFLKIKGIEEPLIIDEELEDGHLSELMDEVDRS